MNSFASIISFLVMVGFLLAILTGHVPGFFEKKPKTRKPTFGQEKKEK